MAANEYFNYVQSTDNNGNTYAHRTGVQAWIVNGNKGGSMTIYVQGPLPDGQYNAFAKKHLMTTTGGRHSPESKLTSISTKRRNESIGVTDQSRDDKLAAMQNFAPKLAEQYKGAGAYGANGIGQGTPLTMIHCDEVTPHNLKEAFATAIRAIPSKKWQTQVGNNGSKNSVAHTNVKFTSNIIYNQLYKLNKITQTNRMAVMVMKAKEINTYHVFHGEPNNATYPNA
jgi:hypothetical protein